MAGITDRLGTFLRRKTRMTFLRDRFIILIFSFVACSQKKRQTFGVFLLEYFLAWKNIRITYVHILKTFRSFTSNWRCRKSFYLSRQNNLHKVLEGSYNSYNSHSPFLFCEQWRQVIELFFWAVVKFRSKEICRTGHLQKVASTRIYIRSVYVSRLAVSLVASGMLQCSIERILFQRHECGES